MTCRDGLFRSASASAAPQSSLRGCRGRCGRDDSFGLPRPAEHVFDQYLAAALAVSGKDLFDPQGQAVAGSAKAPPVRSRLVLRNSSFPAHSQARKLFS